MLTATLGRRLLQVGFVSTFAAAANFSQFGNGSSSTLLNNNNYINICKAPNFFSVMVKIFATKLVLLICFAKMKKNVAIVI